MAPLFVCQLSYRSKAVTVRHSHAFDPEWDDDRAVPVVELLDRLLETGACISGDLLLSVAGIDLVWVGLRSIIASVETARPRDSGVPGQWGASSGRTALSRSQSLSTTPGLSGSEAMRDSKSKDPQRRPEFSAPASARGRPQRSSRGSQSGELGSHASSSAPSRRLDLEEEDVERGLVQLVLTIVDLLRQLMERQAITRMEAGSLDDVEVDRLGTALARLAERMDDLKETFGLSDEDLQLSLGPLDSLT